MGSADPRSFSRGKRGISGSLIFTQFDRDALMSEMKKMYEGAPAMMTFQQFRANDTQTLVNNALTSMAQTNPFGVATWDEVMTQLGYAGGAGFNADQLTDFYVPEYADQLMPFNISISMANEYGQRAGMDIYGVQILNEGSGFSVDDVVAAKAYTFVAKKIKGVEKKDSLRLDGQDSAQSSQGNNFQN